MKRSLSLLAAAIVAGLPAAAHAQCAAPGASFNLQTNYFAFARINGNVYNFSCLIAPSVDGTYQLSYSNNATALSTYTSAGKTMRAFLSNYSITFDPTGAADGTLPGDPNVTYSIATRTTITPENALDPVFDFAFAFGMPIAPNRYITASESEGFSVTNTSNRTVEGVMNTPSGSFAPIATPANYPAALFGPSGVLSQQPAYSTILFNGTTKSNVAIGNTKCQLSDPNPAGRARQTTCDFASGIVPESVMLNSVGVLVEYRQYGVLRNTTNGSATVTATPEPASLALLGSGLLALGGIAARRRRTS
ncbi:MAG: PEP-CTERM sorting domain-containing protein [Gemmatirosa sp.]|nr:PEP-CTERM sorting domain-containing protein [Gemmatirosa sp.]